MIYALAASTQWLFRLFSSLFSPSQNSRIAKIATMPLHKGHFSNLYLFRYFWLFSGFHTKGGYSGYSAIPGGNRMIRIDRVTLARKACIIIALIKHRRPIGIVALGLNS